MIDVTDKAGVSVEQLQDSAIQAPAVNLKNYPSIRMGTSWLLSDVDDKKGLDRVISRVYGDEKGEYGDLLIHTKSTQKTPLVIPSERGVKGIWSLNLDSQEKTKHGSLLYFTDGWVASYGKKAKARLKRVFWKNGRAHVELLLNQNKEFTFFDLWVDHDSKRGQLLWVRGNRFLSLIEIKAKGMWRLHPVHSLSPVVNVAVGQYQGQWYVCVPNEKETMVHDLTLPIW